MSRDSHPDTRGTLGWSPVQAGGSGNRLRRAESIVLMSGCFFFQAEDGIRDRNVTGVQTCALPICLPGRQTGQSGQLGPPPAQLPDARQPRAALRRSQVGGVQEQGQGPRSQAAQQRNVRSEERRVGKECKSRGGTYHKKKKKVHSRE